MTAAVFVVVMLGGLLWNLESFFALFSIVHFGCWWEYQRLMGRIDPAYTKISLFHKYGVMVAGWCVLFLFTNDLYIFFGVPLYVMGKWLGILLVAALTADALSHIKTVRLKNIGYSLLGILYISGSWGAMIAISCHLPHRHTDYIGQPFFLLPLFIILSIWINDTMAYIVGSLFGKTPFSKISPKKTWEGTLGGMILSVLVMGFAGARWADIHPVDAFSIAAIAAIAGTLGDLLESWFKRKAQVKDSGSLMPGHGGFLDRFDSLLLATPFVWGYVVLFI